MRAGRVRADRALGTRPLKYMGSKRAMLQNGLGDTLVSAAGQSERFVDLFCGAGTVAWHVAQNVDVPVLAVDLQEYAVALSGAVVRRATALDPEGMAREWLDAATASTRKSSLWREVGRLSRSRARVANLVKEARALCAKHPRCGPVWRAYGGYYYSPEQALTIDSLLRQMPDDSEKRRVCVAALVQAASMCSASPGHTAQPFRPTETAGPYVVEAWNRDPLEYSRRALREICPRYARKAGVARVADALDVALTLKAGDIAFVDPPYSSVQYSRFYHVLETIARAKVSKVEGAGRYPPRKERPQSDYSKKTTSRGAVRRLLEALADAGATVIVTYPTRMCSNGLSGAYLRSVAKRRFHIERQIFKGHFSTLGANSQVRSARKPSSELILLLKPKGTTR